MNPPGPVTRHKREAVEREYMEHPKLHYKAIAQLAGCSADYAFQTIKLIRLREHFALRKKFAGMDEPPLCDRVAVHQIFASALRWVEVCEQRVNEAKDIDSASDFTRWLLGSGIVEFCEANPYPDPLPVDGKLLRKKCTEVVYQCGERFRTGNKNPSVEASKMQSLNEKMDRIEKLLAEKA